MADATDPEGAEQQPVPATAESSHGDADATLLGIPRRVLAVSTIIGLALLVPLVVGYLVGGGLAAMAVALGFTAALAPALMLPARYAAALVVPAALTGAVAAAVHTEPFSAACFAALACLLVAPANIYANGLLAGLPTAAAVLASNSIPQEPAQVAGWLAVGGLVVVGVVSRIRGEPPEVEGLQPWTAWVHAVAMAASVGIVVGVLVALDVPHGYWIAATLTIVLRPFRGETRASARQRIVGTVAGAVLGLAIALLVPGWLAVVLCLGMLVLVVANALLERPTQIILYITPLIVLLGSGGDTVGAVRDRILATVTGALLAAVIALGIARLTREHEAPDG